MIDYLPYERVHLPGVIALCLAEDWPTFPADAERAHRAMLSPGVTTIVAVAGGEVVGFACLQSDGQVQAHLSLIAVHGAHRRRGIGRCLIARALARAGGFRVDLVTDTAEHFYGALPHRRLAGFRLYPPLDDRRPVSDAGDGRSIVRRARPADDDWATTVLEQRWASTTIVSRNRLHHANRLPAFVAELDGERCGLATYRVDGEEAELVTLDALQRGRGIGTALLEATAEAARAAGCRRLWLVTTNDNVDAIAFYLRRGLRLVAVHRGGADAARRLKPQIPDIGHGGIAVHDEIEMERDLHDRSPDHPSDVSEM